MGVVLRATLIQGVTSYSLTQTLSKAAQTADRRAAPQGAGAHRPAAGRLLRLEQDRHAGVAHHERRGGRAQPDRHRAGGFCGRHSDRAHRAVLLLRISALMTGIAFGLLLVFALVLRQGVQVIRPIFRERAKINAEGHRTSDGIAGRRARGQGLSRRRARARVFAEGVQRLLDNVLQVADRDLADEPFGGSADGRGRRDRDVDRCAPDSRGHTHAGQLLQLHRFPRLTWWRRCSRLSAIGTQLTEAIAGLERTREVLDERAGG